MNTLITYDKEFVLGRLRTGIEDQIKHQISQDKFESERYEALPWYKKIITKDPSWIDPLFGYANNLDYKVSKSRDRIYILHREISAIKLSSETTVQVDSKSLVISYLI